MRSEVVEKMRNEVAEKMCERRNEGAGPIGSRTPGVSEADRSGGKS
ncbi:MAG TPA: hypothetical protein VL978_14440 [Puia sp.]|nr:hypothetical protein [Puia sp.]